MTKKCANCNLVNFPEAITCSRCDLILVAAVKAKTRERTKGADILIRCLICFCVCLAVIFGFYLSLIASAKSLTYDQKVTLRAAIDKLKEKGFSNEAVLLDNFTVYRSNDNWLNASVAKENAYAATNFPFEVMTLYSDFFTYPVDDTERAAILLHEAKHLAGKNEHDAYEFVWKHREQLGWTKENYSGSFVWQNIRKQTRDNAPNLFVCDLNEFADCTD